MIPRTPVELRDHFGRVPTADLYFLNSLAHLKRRAVGLPRTRILAPNVYAVGRTGVIVRYGKAEHLDQLRQAGVRQIVYIADDDFAAGASDLYLPEGYRARLAAFSASAWPALKAAADIVIVPGAVLAEIYGPKARIVPPVWHRPPAPADHFTQARRIEMVHLGTGSHLSDFSPLAPAMAAILRTHGNARLTLFSGDSVPETLRRHAQVRARPPMAWWRYRLALPRMRFHLALYPLRHTPFNRARSANKLFEHALAGAASLMTPIPALREAAGGLSETFVEGGPDEWRRKIEAALADPEALRRGAEAMRAQILSTDAPRRAADVWLDILAPEI